MKRVTNTGASLYGDDQSSTRLAKANFLQAEERCQELFSLHFVVRLWSSKG